MSRGGGEEKSIGNDVVCNCTHILYVRAHTQTVLSPPPTPLSLSSSADRVARCLFASKQVYENKQQHGAGQTN